MKEYLLLLPIIFIFHDMEEIIGFGWFLRKNPWVYERYPRITEGYQGFTTEVFALGVYEEFIPFFGVSLLAYYFPNRILTALWFGLMLALTAHFVGHIALCACIKMFIPSVITSVICLPIGIIILTKTANFLSFDYVTILSVLIGVIVMILNLTFVHWFMQKLNQLQFPKNAKQ